MLALDGARTALLVIDMQNDFLDPEGYFGRQGWPVGRLRRAIEPLVRLRATLPVTTRVIYTAQIYEPDGSDEISRCHRIGPVAQRKGDGFPTARASWGAEIIPALAPRPGEAVIQKRRFDAFYQTDLEHLLRHLGVQTLILAGVVADICVGTTARSAFVRDFDVVLARECVTAWDPACEAENEHSVSKHLGLVLSVDEIVSALSGAGK